MATPRHLCARTIGTLFVGLVLACAFGCRPAQSGGLAASEDENEPQPKEMVYRAYAPRALGDLADYEEHPCGEPPIQYVRATATAQGRYWVLDDQSSRLFSFDAAFEHRQAHLTKQKVDLIRRADDGSLWAVVNEENRWRFLRRDRTGWQHLGDLPAMGRAEDAVGERQGRPALTTQEGETYWFDASGLVHVWTIPAPEDAPRRRWNRGRRTLASTNDGALYVGREDGEFGGGLARIDVGTANRRTVQTQAFDGPMTDIVVDPTDRRCVVSSNGTIHGNGNGLVVRACPDRVSVVLKEMQVPKQRTRWTVEASEPFFKLVANGSTVYALGDTENYAITGSTTHRLPAPTYTERCGQTVARVEGLMLMRIPALGRRDLPYERLGQNLFAMPAL
ncbi:hypothetical protein AKJ09_04974 [Labilithrix luteola]|uniref:Uncharacterized protein n=1 Tax=Labilithrix luteola TaxID=1391654 RepID=A0A0K1PXR1_9BACT|nr:hypothetical protein [Labilithrix luteola]AKU98310.1 hypothetical protein AKJ09_04974 [Labilithrix luteola]